ncbi:YdcF family protein [Hydrogenimonas sp.]
MRKLFFIGIVIIGLSVYSFLNLGNFLDVSETPKKVDLIASLGGDRLGYRIRKAYELYAGGYSKSGKIVINPRYDAHAAAYLAETNVSKNMIVTMDDNATNTMGELSFIRNYMLAHNMQSVIVVSDPPHLRRIKFFATTLVPFEEDGLQCIVVGSTPPWWRDKHHYYRHGFAIANAMSELAKFIFDYIKYGVLMKLGMWEPIENFFAPYRDDLKKIYIKTYRALWTIYN